jgi:hypothetical protein
MLLLRVLTSVVFVLAMVDCGGGSVTSVPQPSAGAPLPFAPGTLAVYSNYFNDRTVSVYQPNSDKEYRRFTLPDKTWQAEAMAFDHRGVLSLAIKDAKGAHILLEYSVPEGRIIHIVTFAKTPGEFDSEIAVDDQNYIYLNSRTLLGGDVLIVRGGSVVTRIKTARIPLSLLVANNFLWVGFQGFIKGRVQWYRLRSTDQVGGFDVGPIRPQKLALSKDGSRIAILAHDPAGNVGRVVSISVETRLGKDILRHQKLLTALARDNADNLYVGAGYPGRAYHCTFLACTTTLPTGFPIVADVAVSPVTQDVYLAGYSSDSVDGQVEVYQARTLRLIRTIKGKDFSPRLLALEP